MLQGEHSAIRLAFIKLPFVIKIYVLSVFEWPFYTSFTVRVICVHITLHVRAVYRLLLEVVNIYDYQCLVLLFELIIDLLANVSIYNDQRLWVHFWGSRICG